MAAVITPTVRQETSGEVRAHDANTGAHLGELDRHAAELDLSLHERFDDARLSILCRDYLERGTSQNLLEMASGRSFVVVPIDAESPYADIGVSVETQVFAKRFKRTWADVYTEYEKTNADSTLLCLISLEDENPKPVGAIRIIEPNVEAGLFAGLKSVEDLVIDSGDPEQTPWIDEIKALHFAEGEAYDPAVAWSRLCDSADIFIDPQEAHDVATISVVPGYDGKNGGKKKTESAVSEAEQPTAEDDTIVMSSASMLLYHTCLRYALGNNIKNLVSIQDLAPYGVLKQFGEPFSEFPGLTPKKYGGPYDTIPAVSMLVDGMARIRNFNEEVGSIFIDGFALGHDALLLDEINPDQYSNAAVSLPEVA